MLPYIILAILVLIVLSIIIFEIRNEKKYQESRRQEQNKKPKNNQNRTKPSVPQKPTSQTYENTQSSTISLAPEETKPEIIKDIKVLPKCQYPTFKHDRLIDMGLSNDEAREFVGELIGQLDEHTIQIDNAIDNADIKQLEYLTHTIKGSASNLGTGGVTDLLADFNTYLREGTDMDIIKRYADSLASYTTKLKTQYA